MSFRVRCECGESLTVPENKAGMRVRCPLCSRHVTIPPPRPKGPPDLPKDSTQRKEPSDASVQAKPQAVEDESEASTLAAAPTGGNAPRLRPQPRPLEPRLAPSPPPPSPPPRKSRQKDGRRKMPPPLKSKDSQPVPAKPPADARKESPPAPPQLPKKKEAAKDSVRAEPSVEPVPEQEAMRGVEHDPGKRWTVYQLGMAVAALALVGMYPSVAEVVRHWTDFDSTGMEAWAWLLFFLTGIQLAYALYMVQLPDWSTTWVVMVVCTCATVFYAMGTGISLMAQPDNELLGALGLTVLQTKGYLSLWCLMMTLLMSLLTYFLVRASVKWHKSFELAMAGRG